MAIIVDGNRIAEEILEALRFKIKDLRVSNVRPCLAVVQAGENPVSSSYIKIKQEKASEVGIEVRVNNFPEHTHKEELINHLKDLNGDQSVHGIIIQLPLPANLPAEEILDEILPEKDVDCLTTTGKEQLTSGQEMQYLPPAAAAVLKILDYYHVDLPHCEILLIGSGDLVGKPLASLLLRRKISFRLANQFTEDLAALTKNADLIISATGQPGLIRGEMVKDGVILIDAGTAGVEVGHLEGDIDTVSLVPKAKLLTPVPGGVGPVTVAILLENVVTAASLVPVKFDTFLPR